MHQYCAILGRQPEFSAAEIIAVSPLFGDCVVRTAGENAVVIDAACEPGALQERCAGIVKIGEVVATLGTVRATLADAFVATLFAQVPKEGKAVFGVSWYGQNGTETAGKLERALKRHGTTAGRSCRFISGEKGVVSSVVVVKQGLLTKGREFCIVDTGSSVVVAVTKTAQPFEEYASRDYGRPKRDTASGMLPPKLARMMINLAGVDAAVPLLDPFCGSGTILQEAALLGYLHVTGTDRSEKAVQESRENITWLAEQQNNLRTRAGIQQADISELSKHIAPASVGAIITEPYLGPPQRGGENVRAIRADCEQLYERTFRIFASIVRPAGVVVFVFPVFYRDDKPQFIMNLDALLATGFSIRQPLSPAFVQLYRNRLTYRNTLLYRRPGQRVGREIIIFARHA